MAVDSGPFDVNPSVDARAEGMDAARDRGGSPGTCGSTVPAAELTGSISIGPFRLIQMIGEGGMGEVWLADQTSPVRRRVALKLIKAGMYSRQVAARFDAERQALALMDHPSIAKIFDAGIDALGRPYLVMEYVPGLPITEFCDKHKLKLRERLQLFARVCEGVQHAHQKAIIHRDLKPSNILVTEVDGRPFPKIIDFGIAKAIGPRLNFETMFTCAGTLIGTPEYMSPEQTDASGEDIDTRTDVYSLGIILYEALVGELPRDYRKLAFDEMLRRIREEEPPRPSTKVRTLGEHSTSVANNRRTGPHALTRELRGDLDSIALKCIEKDRNRRYGSPAEIVADIERYLRDEPISAAPPSITYRAKKYINRHRFAVSAVVIIFVLAVAFAITEAVQLRRITRERDRSDRVAQFMRDIFAVSAPFPATRGTSIPASEILDKAEREIDLEFKTDPELQARLLQEIGEIYSNLGFRSRAEELLRRAVAIDSSVLGPNNREALQSTAALAAILSHGSDPKGAEKMLRDTLATQRRVLDSNDPDTIRSMQVLANNLWIPGKKAYIPEAEALNREALERSQHVFGSDDRRTWLARWRLFTLLAATHKNIEAAQLGQESLDNVARLFGKNDPQTLACARTLALFFMQLKQYPQAEAAARQAADIERNLPGSDLSRFALRDVVAAALARQGKYEQAKQLEEDVLDEKRRALGENNPQVALSMYNLGCYSAHLGERDEALSWLRKALDHHLTDDDIVLFRTDPDLASLRQDPRFIALEAAADRLHAGRGAAQK